MENSVNCCTKILKTLPPHSMSGSTQSVHHHHHHHIAQSSHSINAIGPAQSVQWCGTQRTTVVKSHHQRTARALHPRKPPKHHLRCCCMGSITNTDHTHPQRTSSLRSLLQIRPAAAVADANAVAKCHCAQLLLPPASMLPRLSGLKKALNLSRGSCATSASLGMSVSPSAFWKSPGRLWSCRRV
jgi:hypothetical protein